MSITPDPLTDLTTVKLALGIPSSDISQDAFLNILILQASRTISNQTNRPFFLASNAANPLTQYYSGNGDVMLCLRLYPVQSIVSIYEDQTGYWGQSSNAFASTTLLEPGVDYSLVLDGWAGTASESGRVARLDDSWEDQWIREPTMLSAERIGGFGNIKVTYVYGFSALPADIQYAATLVVARMKNTFPFGGPLQSERFEEYNYALGAQNNDGSFLGLLGGEVGQILANYYIPPWAST